MKWDKGLSGQTQQFGNAEQAEIQETKAICAMKVLRASSGWADKIDFFS